MNTATSIHKNRGSSMVEISKYKYGDDDLKLITDILEDPESLSFMILFQKYRPLVFATIGAFHFRYYDNDDLKVEAMMVCYQSVQDFDPNRRSSFGSFFKANLTNYFFTLLRNQKAKKRQHDLFTSSYESLLINNGSGYLGPDYTNMSPDRHLLLQEDFKKLSKVLSPLEVQVMEMYCSPNAFSKHNIAENLQISDDRLYNARSRCKIKTKKVIYS